MKTKRIFTYWAPVILWMIFIFWMSTDTFSPENTSTIIEPILRFLAASISKQGIDTVHEIIRKLAHVTEYLILGILLFRAFRGGGAERGIWRSALYSVLIVVLYASSDEFHQSFTAARTASLIDVGIDSFGGLLAQCASVLWSHHRYR